MHTTITCSLHPHPPPSKRKKYIITMWRTQTRTNKKKPLFFGFWVLSAEYPPKNKDGCLKNHCEWVYMQHIESRPKFGQMEPETETCDQIKNSLYRTRQGSIYGLPKIAFHICPPLWKLTAKASENWWLEDASFLFGLGLFSGANC